MKPQLLKNKQIILVCECGNRVYLSRKLNRFSIIRWKDKWGILPLTCNKCGKLINENNAQYKYEEISRGE